MSSFSVEQRSAVLTASGAVCANDGAYVGYVVSVVTAAGTIFVRDGTGVGGTIIDVIPAATAVGASRNLSRPIRFRTGLYVEFNGGATGSVTFFYD